MGVLKRLSSAWSAFVGREATSIQRAHAVGHVAGYPISNHYEALNHVTGWNFVAAHTVGKQWAQASVTVYDDQGGDDGAVRKAFAPDAPAEQRKPLQNHPALKLLKRPNPVMGQQQFLHQIGLHCRTTGGWVIWEVRNKLGLPCELWALPRAWLSYQTPSDEFPLGLWRVHNPRGIGSYLRDNRLAGGFMIDVRDTIIGGWSHPLYPGEPLSPLDQCSQIIDIAEKADDAVWASLVNSPRPGMILSLDPGVHLSEEQQTQLVDEITKLKAGTHNAGKVMLAQGVKPEHIGTPMADLDAVNVRDQSRKFVQAVQGVPNIATGSSDDVTYAGGAAALNAFVELSIQPDLDLFASSLTHRWQRYWGEDFKLELNAKRYDDPTLDLQRVEKLIQMAGAGLAKPNEVRAAMKLPPIPGGDEIKQPPQPGQPGMPGDPNAQPQDAPPEGMGDEFDLSPDDPTDAVDTDTFDLSPDLGDDETTGTRNPLLSRAGGRAFSANGSY